MSTNKITHYSSEEQLFHNQPPQQHHPHYGFQQQLHFQHSSDDKQQLIDNIGVSRRLGDSVINELDNRATNLLANLTASAISNSYTDNDSGIEKSSHKNFSSRFESVHGELIQNMDSIDTHYAVKRNRQGLNVPATPTRYSIQDAMNSNSVAKDTDRAELLYNKRARDSMGNVVERLTNSPVTDITRRIRRLRMNMNTPREHHREQERQRRRSSIVRQSLTGSTDKENHLPKSKGYTNLYGEIRSSSSSTSSDISSSSFLHDSAPTFAKPTITSIQKMLTPFIRHNHDSGPIFSTYRKRPSPAASSCSPNTSLQSQRQSSPIPTPKQQVTVSSRSQSAGPSTCISGATKFRPQLSLDTGRELQLEDSANSHEKSRVVASKNVFERLYNQPTTSANKKTTIRKSTTQGDLSYISKHKNNSGESFDSAYDSTYGATKTSSAHSSLPRSRTIGDIKAAKSRNESLPLHPTSTLPRSTTGGDLSLRGNAVTVTSRRPIWR